MLTAPRDPDGRWWCHHCFRVPFGEVAGTEHTSDKCLLGGGLEEEKWVYTREPGRGLSVVPDTRL